MKKHVRYPDCQPALLTPNALKPRNTNARLGGTILSGTLRHSSPGWRTASLFGSAVFVSRTIRVMQPCVPKS